MKFHPATQILTWCLLVATMQALALGALLMFTGFILLAASALSRHKFLQLLRRTRWIMLSLLLIYAYSTPGQPLSDSLGIFAPTREGLVDGMLQLARLLAALAGLAILLDRLHRQQLIAGLHTLFAPLQWLGLSRERLSVRLALTLHYAEVAMLRDSQPWQAILRSLFEPHDEAGYGKQMELPMCRLTLSDVLLLSSMFLMLVMAMQ